MLLDKQYVIIADLDGLLVDTEKLFYEAFRKIAHKYGYNTSFHEYADQVVSEGLEITELLGLDDSKANVFRQEVYVKYWELLRDDLKLKKGARSFLERFKKQHLVLVTGSKREYVDFILKRFGLADYFEKIFTRDDGFAPKPDPAVFEHIISLYSKNRWEYLVVEDSKRGITAALKANISCILVPNEYTVNGGHLDPSVKQFRSLDEITIEVVVRILREARPKSGYTIAHVTRDSEARLEEVFNIYRDIYGLEESIHDDELVDPAAFDYVLKRKYFVILSILTRDGRVYFQRSFDSGHLTMMLPGSGIHMNANEGILEAINRLAQKVLRGARLADIAPVIYLRNRFKCQDGRVHEHMGLGVRALLLNDENDIARYGGDISVKGDFLKNYQDSLVLQPPAKNTYAKVLDWLNRKDYSTYLNEVEDKREFSTRYHFHQTVVKPIFRGLSYVFCEYNLPYVKRFVNDAVNDAQRFLDVSCGDDKTVFNVLRNVPLVVANDISPDHLLQMQDDYDSTYKKLPTRNTVLFTNHDCLDLPFRDDAFDVALCRNTLHHMKTAQDIRILLRNVRRVAKKAIIVDIDDPSRKGLWERLRHKYYIDFLQDQGKNLLSPEEFRDIIGECFSGDKIDYHRHSTIRGAYMTAIVSKHS